MTLDKARWMLGEFVYPRLGDKLVTEIKAPDLLAALRVVESKGLHETATRTKQKVGQILRYAIATGRAERDITADLARRSGAGADEEPSGDHGPRPGG